MAGESAEHGHESVTSVPEANFGQYTGNCSGPDDPIELQDHPGQQSEFSTTQSNAPLVSKTPQPVPGVVARLGLWIIITNIGAVVLLVSAISALSFLWFSNEKNEQWRRVMVDGWIGQAVTLSTLAIRLAVSIQAGTAVAMLASVSLESKLFGGVPLPEAPSLSIARYANTGPLGTFLPFWRDFGWRFKSPMLSILVLAATTLVSQFTSTLLLWDVRSNVIHGPPGLIESGIGFAIDICCATDSPADNVDESQNYWLVRPPSYPTFAEWGLPPSKLPESIVDTGPSIRAFLPLSSEADRSVILEFQGMAPAMDSRVVCVRPTIKDWSFIGANIFNATLLPLKETGDLANTLHHNISSDGYPLKLSFRNLLSGSDTNFMVHSLPPFVGGLLSNLSVKHSKTSEYEGDVIGHAFLLIHVGPDAVVPTDSGFVFDVPDDAVNRDFTIDERGPWLLFTPNEKKDDFKNAGMNITLCYDAMNRITSQRLKMLQDFPISATRKSNYSEPKLDWNSTERKFNTTAIRAQLNSIQTPLDDSKFSLDPTNLNKAVESFQWATNISQIIPVFDYWVNWYYNDSYYVDEKMEVVKKEGAPPETYDFLTDLVWGQLNLKEYDTFEIYLTCQACGVPSDAERTVGTGVNPVFSSVFVETLKETDNPALAWQAIVTSVMRVAYYDWLPTFDYAGNSTITSAVPCQKPDQTRGFIFVMVNLLVHLVMVMICSFWFFTCTQYSLLGNAWQAIAQMKAPETELYLDTATMLNDEKVKDEIDRKWIRRRFNIRRNDEDDRVCLS